LLVLTHKEGEVLEIGPDIRIHVKRIKGNWVRLCIDAPRDVVLRRLSAEEVLLAAEEDEGAGGAG
jgi:carbon storage regulator CsrA